MVVQKELLCKAECMGTTQQVNLSQPHAAATEGQAGLCGIKTRPAKDTAEYIRHEELTHRNLRVLRPC